MSEDMFETILKVPVKALGERYTVWLDTSNGIGGGQFVIKLSKDDELRAKSLGELRALAADYSAVRFALPFTAAEPEGSVNGTVTGFHASNGSLLIRWETGGTQQMPRFQASRLLHRLDEAQAAELERLLEDRNKAVAALESFKREHVYDDIVDAALAAQLEARKTDGH